MHDPPTPRLIRSRTITDPRARTVYECTSCGERFVGVRRCPDCNWFMHALATAACAFTATSRYSSPNSLRTEVLRCSAKSALPLSGRF